MSEGSVNFVVHFVRESWFYVYLHFLLVQGSVFVHFFLQLFRLQVLSALDELGYSNDTVVAFVVRLLHVRPAILSH